MPRDIGLVCQPRQDLFIHYERRDFNIPYIGAKISLLRLPRLTFADLAFAVLLWALLIARYGYTYGTNDHIELLPYVLFLKNPSLYPHDLFIQSLHASLPNERTVVAHLFLPFADHLRVFVFAIHFFNTLLLLLALIKLARRFIDNKYVSWLAVYISILVLNDRGLGNVDLYTPAIQASDISCMIIAWALNVFLDRRYVLAAMLMCVASYIHVLEGFDVMVVLSGIMLLKWSWDKEASLKEVLTFYGIYALTVLPYLFFIYRAKTNGAGALTQHELFEIMFAFRHPHHFIFSTFPMFNKILFVFCIAMSLLYYRARTNALFQFVLISALGVCAYIVCVDVLHIVAVANFQWYKVVQWTKFMGIVAAFALVYNYLDAYIAGENKWLDYASGIAGLASLVCMFYLFGKGAFNKGYRQYNEQEIALCQKVKELSAKDAVFIQPFEMTALKFYGQRSSYVEFKAIAKNQKDLKVWYDRVQEVFGLNYEVDKSGFNMQEKANAHLDNLNEEQLFALKQEGVTNIICRTTKYKQEHKLLLSENGYFVYQL